MRIDKMLVQSNIGTRKAVKAMIREGLVAINKEVITDSTVEITQSKDIILFRGKVISYLEPVYYMFHKPQGCITARKDSKHKTVLDYFKEVEVGGLFPVGRLDKDTEGLLLLTNDGEFNHRIMYPTQNVDKIYYFLAFGTLNQQEQKEIEAGVLLRGDENITRPSKLTISEVGILRELIKDKDIFVDVIRKPELLEREVISGYLTISEGRKHQVKRMLKTKGCNVFYLKRISIGGITLDPNLKKGNYRRLTLKEKNTI